MFRSSSAALFRLGRKSHARNPPNGGFLSSSLSLGEMIIHPRRNDNDDDCCHTQHVVSSSDNVRRLYHSTPKRDIVPLIALGTVILIGRYSWKALNRMDTEWEDYLWELKQYERARVNAAADATVTIGVDLGTFYLKLSRMNKNKPELIETAQGDRYRFNGILLQDNDEVVMGTPALDKFYYKPIDTTIQDDTNTNTNSNSEVILPYKELQGESHNDATALVQKVFVPAVAEAMERIVSDDGDNKDDEKKNLRTVLALPPIFYNKHGDKLFRKNYHDNSHHTITVPEPVAAIWGAQALNLIPTPKSKEENTSSSTLVMDVGGLASTISLVREDKVVWSVTLDGIGGESLVQQLVERILVETEDETMGKDVMSLTLIESNARSSVLELVNKTQSKIHIPFLYMGRKPTDPHLDTTISRTVLEQAVQDNWNTAIVPKLMDDDVLSSSLPTPTNATSLFTSAVAKVLEESNEMPSNIERILLVGGGSKHRMFEEACKDSISALMGPSDSLNKIVLPETSVRAELTALGASSLLPNFDYDYERDLKWYSIKYKSERLVSSHL
jgi:molecular chaperone DnaK (HSP70)